MVESLSGESGTPSAPWVPAYIALGSNLDDPAQQVRSAFVQLQALPDTRLILSSSLYQSAPMGPQDQPSFINAVAGVLTQLGPYELLAQLQAIERNMGRQSPVMRWGPRVIDLDILMYWEAQSAAADLQLPHPGMLLRNFVMIPLSEIAPYLLVAKGLLAGQVAQQLGMTGLQRLPDVIP